MGKYIVCLGDGMADLPLPDRDNLTPLQIAKTPNMDRIAQMGSAGLVETVPDGFSPGSDVANMGLLGYDANDYYTGRGPIEAAAMGIEPPDGMMVFRCNLVTIQNGTMIDFTAGHVSTEEADQLLQELNAAFSDDDAIFHCGVSYRHILLLSDRYAELSSNAPHDVTDKPVADYWPQGPQSDDLAEFIGRCREILAGSSVNAARVAEGKRPVTDIWPWSQGVMPSYPSFESQYGMTGGIVTAVDLLKGLAILSGLECPHVPGATGFIDTNYQAKVSAGLTILESHDFLYLHVEAPDEAGHMGDVDLKIRAIEDFDTNVVGPILEYQVSREDVRVMVLPDHPTPCAIKTHIREKVPIAMCGPGVSVDAAAAYDEQSVRVGELDFDSPWALLGRFLGA